MSDNIHSARENAVTWSERRLCPSMVYGRLTESRVFWNVIQTLCTMCSLTLAHFLQLFLGSIQFPGIVSHCWVCVCLLHVRICFFHQWACFMRTAEQPLSCQLQGLAWDWECVAMVLRLGIEQRMNMMGCWRCDVNAVIYSSRNVLVIIKMQKCNKKWKEKKKTNLYKKKRKY